MGVPIIYDDGEGKWGTLCTLQSIGTLLALDTTFAKILWPRFRNKTQYVIHEDKVSNNFCDQKNINFFK